MQRKLSMGYFLLCLILSSNAFAQSDIIGTAGQYATQTGARGAVANRRLADSLYQQSLADEKAAWSGGIPNVSLLTKSLNESKDAKSADDQAKEFARGALYGGQTASASGNYQAAAYGGLSQDQLTDLATNSSPYMPAVQSKMSGYGLKLDADKMALSTPFGKFPVGMSSSDLEKTLVGVATSLGFSGDGVSQGIKDAEKTRDALAASTVAQVDKELAARGALATSKGSTPAANAAAASAATAADGGRGVAAAQTATVASSKDVDWDSKLRANQANQDAIRRQMGLRVLGAREPIGRADEDIFQKIHLKYQALDEQGEFLGAVLPKTQVAQNPPRE